MNSPLLPGLLLVSLLMSVGCSGKGPEPQEPNELSNSAVAEVIARHNDEIMALEHVVAIGESLCDGEPCIRVYLTDPDSPTLNSLPTELDGIPVTTDITTTPRAGL